MNKSPGLAALEVEVDARVSEQHASPLESAETPPVQSDAVREFMARLAEAQAAEATQPTPEERREQQVRIAEAERAERAQIEERMLESVMQINAKNSQDILRFSHLTGVSRIEELVPIVQDYIKYCFKSELRGVRIYEINRKFGMKARRIASNAVDLAGLITKDGGITVTVYMGITLFYPTRDYMKHTWALKDVPAREAFRADMLERSMDSMPRSVRTGTGRRRRKAV